MTSNQISVLQLCRSWMHYRELSPGQKRTALSLLRRGLLYSHGFGAARQVSTCGRAYRTSTRQARRIGGTYSGPA